MILVIENVGNARGKKIHLTLKCILMSLNSVFLVQISFSFSLGVSEGRPSIRNRISIAFPDGRVKVVEAVAGLGTSFGDVESI